MDLDALKSVQLLEYKKYLFRATRGLHYKTSEACTVLGEVPTAVTATDYAAA